MKGSDFTEDSKIIKLYFERNEEAISATDEKYGAYCMKISQNILGNTEDAKKYVDECIALQDCNGSTGGVLYATETYASLPWEFHAWESLVSSAWLYLIINIPDVLFPRTLRQVYYMAKIPDIQDEKS